MFFYILGLSDIEIFIALSLYDIVHIYFFSAIFSLSILRLCQKLHKRFFCYMKCTFCHYEVTLSLVKFYALEFISFDINIVA